MKIKLLTLGITLLMGAMGAGAQTVEVDGIYYNLSGTEAEVTEHPSSGYAGDIVIPDMINHGGTDYSVTMIGHVAFGYCTALASITIPNSVSWIGINAFSLCENLTSINVESENPNYSSIGGVLFDKDKTILIRYPEGKKENNYVIPNGVTTIEDYAFCDCIALESVTIPNSVTTIEDNAFSSCFALKSITIPNSVTKIGFGAFYSCFALESINLPNSVTTIGAWAFADCNALKSTTITIPNCVASIERYTFYNCRSLTSITISSSVTSIGESAFQDCTALTSITNLNPMPVEISWNVFSNIDENCTLKVPTNAVSAYQNAEFWQEFNIVGGGMLVNPIPNSCEYGYTNGNALYQANAYATVTATAYDGYKFVNWTENNIEVSTANPYSFTVTKDVELVANFESSYQWEIGFPNPPDVIATLNLNDSTLTITGTGAMKDFEEWRMPPWFDYWESITTAVIGDSVTTIGNGAFFDCKALTSVFIGNRVTTIGNQAFDRCSSLTSIDLKSVESIGKWAFSGIGAAAIDIPNSVNFLGREAFGWLNGILTDVTVNWDVPYVPQDDPFAPTTDVSNVNLHIPCGNNSYADADVWKAFNVLQCWEIGASNPADVIATLNLNDSTLTITGTGAMRNFGGPPLFDSHLIKTAVIENGVTTIGNYAFLACWSLTSVTIGDSVTTIGEEAFNECFALMFVSIGNSVTMIGENAFSNCTALESITIPNSVTTIGDWAFYGCVALTSITVENENPNYSSIDGVLFNKNKTVLICYPAGKKRSNYAIPNGVTTIEQGAFVCCTALESITIPSSVTTIGLGAFVRCHALAFITIPNSVTTIGDWAFYGCVALTSITNLNPIPVEITPEVFEYVNQPACTLKVYRDAVSAYKNAEVWKEFNIIGCDYLVEVSANNAEYGYATGYELYEEGATATVTATAYDGYKFVNWTKDGVEVFTNNPYAFKVTEDVTLIANFTSTQETSLDFDTYCATKWNNTFLLNLQKLQDSGYIDSTYNYSDIVTHYTCAWFKDGKKIIGRDGFFYSVGDSDSNYLEGKYHFELVEKYTYDTLRSTKKIISFTKSSWRVYPNPVPQGSRLVIEGTEAGAPVEVYDITGICVKRATAVGNVTELTLIVPAGVYVVRSNNEETKVIIK